MSRSLILWRIRRALDGTEVPELSTRLPEFPKYADPVEQFGRELERAGGVFLDARSENRLLPALTTVLQRTKVTEICWEGEHVFHKYGIPTRSHRLESSAQPHLVYSFHASQKIEFPLTLYSRSYRRSDLERIELSASGCLFGIAETGTVVHGVQSGWGRVLPVLPPAHLAFLSRKDLLMNQSELFCSLRPGGAGSAMTLVTGPSRTADIEKTLVLGVHGPKQCFVILTP